MSEYLEFWKNFGLEHITPKGVDNPEGFDVAEVLKSLIPQEGTVLEVGCGTGRLSGIFSPTIYTGVDINVTALDIARKKNPHHSYKLIPALGDLPLADHLLLYTVLLHVPDDLIVEQIRKITEAACETVVIAECMDSSFRVKDSTSLEYNMSNQRAAENYIWLMHDRGFYLDEQVVKRYNYYTKKEVFITFLKFSRSTLGVE